MAGGLVAAFVLVFALMFLDVGVGGIKGADPTVKGGEFREVGFDFVGGFAAVTVGDFRVGVHDGLVGLEQLCPATFGRGIAPPSGWPQY